MTCTTILALTAALFSPGQVRIEMFPRPEPVVIRMFPEPEPVVLKMFPDPVKKPVKVPAPFEQPPAAPKLPTVFVYVGPECIKCEQCKADYAAAMRRGDLIPFVFRFESDVPAWVQSVPTLHFRSPQGWKKIEGWSGMDRFAKQYHDAMQKPVHKAAMPVPQASHRWTYPGRIDEHLKWQHGWKETEGLSREQMERIHDALHEGLISPNAQQATPETSRRRSRRGRSPVHYATAPKQFDPFLAISLIGLLFDAANYFCPLH